MKSMLKSLMSVAAAALALTSCSTDATDEVIAKGELKTLKVNATIEQTRTTLATDHVNLAWSEGDEILLYIGDKLNDGDEIAHKIGANDINDINYNEGDVVYANYSLDNAKYSKGATLAEIFIMGTQTQSKANDFAGKNLPMVAKGAINGDKVDLTFHPVGCVLVFNVYGPAADEKIESITLKTAENCYGFKNCDLTAGLTAEAIGYKDLSGKGTGNSIKVTLDTPATIGTSKPTDTKKGENQVYMVVAPFNYTSATFTVTTNVGSYTFETANGIDCSASTARVVNLNLSKSAELKPAISVSPVNQQPANGGRLEISGITFKNITEEQAANVEVGVFSDAELKNSIENPWISISNPVAIVNGAFNCEIQPNEGTEARTAYIGIKCAGAQAAITITQVGSNSTPAAPDPTVAEVSKIVTSGTYKEYETTDWIVTCGGGLNEGIASLGSNNSDSSIANCYLHNHEALAKAMGFTSPYNDDQETEKAAAIISKKALPAGYNTVKVEYNNVKAATRVAIAFSTDDGATWTKIMDFVALNTSTSAGSQTYTFPQQGAGRYAFVAQAKANNSRITNCKITYSQE